MHLRKLKGKKIISTIFTKELSEESKEKINARALVTIGTNIMNNRFEPNGSTTDYSYCRFGAEALAKLLQTIEAQIGGS